MRGREAAFGGTTKLNMRIIGMLRTRGIFLRTVFSFLLLSITIIGEAMDLDKIKQVTGGKGFFSVMVTNDGSEAVWINVQVYMENPPSGCEHLSSGDSESIVIKAHQTETLELLVPFITTSEDYDDIDEYEATDKRLPLANDARVVVYVEKVGMELEPAIPEHTRQFEARYLPGSRLMELPQVVPININYSYDLEGIVVPDWLMRVVRSPDTK